MEMQEHYDEFFEVTYAILSVVSCGVCLLQTLPTLPTCKAVDDV